MKKYVLILFFLTVTLSGCCQNNSELIDFGRYEFEKAVVTNITTSYVTEMVFIDIYQSDTWQWLLGFSVDVNESTVISNNKITTNGLVYELENNKVKLHFPNWNGYNIAVILGNHKVYGV